MNTKITPEDKYEYQYKPRFDEIIKEYSISLSFKNEDYLLELSLLRNNEVLIKCYNRNIFFEDRIKTKFLQILHYKFKEYSNPLEIYNLFLQSLKSNNVFIKNLDDINQFLVLSFPIFIKNSKEILIEIVLKKKIIDIDNYDLLNKINKLNNNIYEMKLYYDSEIAKLKDDNLKKKKEIDGIKGVVNINDIINISNNNNASIGQKEEGKNYLEEFNKRFNKNITEEEKKLDLSNNYLNNTKIPQFLNNDGFYLLCHIQFNHLKKLFLINNNISDISSLKNAKFQEIEELNLEQNNIENANVFSEIQLLELKILNLSKNKIKDISFLENSFLPKLEKLRINKNNITDINVLEKIKMDNLKFIDISSNKIDDLTVFERANLKKLEFLNMDSINFGDISTLERTKFFSLKTLKLKGIDLSINNNRSVIDKLKEKDIDVQLEEYNFNNINMI